jgi:O-antigen/teichoic acid export membrane protein
LLYLSSAFSVATLGGFFSVRQLLFGIVLVVNNSIRQVVFAHAAQMKHRLASAKRSLLTMSAGIAVAAGLGLGWLWIYATEVTGILFGDQWLDAAGMLPWIALQASIVAVTGWHDRLLDIAGRQRLAVLLQAGGDIALLVVIGSLWVASASPQVAVAIVSVTIFAYNAVWLSVIYHVTGSGAKCVALPLGLLLASTLCAALLASAAKVGVGANYGIFTSFAVIATAAATALVIVVRTLARHSVPHPQ